MFEFAIRRANLARVEAGFYSTSDLAHPTMNDWAMNRECSLVVSECILPVLDGYRSRNRTVHIRTLIILKH